MYDALSHPVLVEALTRVIGPNVKCMQSMLFIKSNGKPGQAWHQDEIYIPTRDRSLTGGWFALDDATAENGCLWVIPGSHARGVLWPQRVQHDPRFDCAHETFRFPYADDDAIPVEVQTGALVLFHGYLLHRSLPNRANSGFPPRARQPLHERGIPSALARPQTRRAHGDRRFSRDRHGRRRRPVRVQRHANVWTPPSALRRRRRMRRWPAKCAVMSFGTDPQARAGKFLQCPHPHRSPRSV